MEHFRETTSPCLTGCRGACCRAGMRLPLFPHEAQALENTGTALMYLGTTEEALSYVERWRVQLYQQGYPAQDIEAALARYIQSYYQLMNNCGNLTYEGLCAVWGTEQQPMTCRNTPPASDMCTASRKVHGMGQVYSNGNGSYFVALTDIEVN